MAGRVGDEGVAVLMRYTLRLLTIQQFQRATALICACESIRRKALEHGDKRWGSTPFRIGLWVGRRTTPNRTDDAVEAIKQARGNQFVGGGVGTPYQLTACPWCGSAIEAGKHLEAQPYPQGSGRTLTYCGDKFGQCLFSKRQADGEGLPVVVGGLFYLSCRRGAYSLRFLGGRRVFSCSRCRSCSFLPLTLHLLHNSSLFLSLPVASDPPQSVASFSFYAIAT